LTFIWSDQSMPEIIARKDLKAETSYSPSTIYSLIRVGEFPPPIRLGPNRVGWRRSDIAEWLRSREEETERMFMGLDPLPEKVAASLDRQRRATVASRAKRIAQRTDPGRVRTI
jgi:prophage regulatory protein